MSALLTLFHQGGVSAGFTPLDLTSLRAWYKADALSLNDNDAVATWPDSSGNGYDLAQAVGAAQPTYKTNIVNGRPVVRTVDDYMGTASGAGTRFFSASAATIWLVYKQPAASSVGAPFIWGTHDVTNAVGLFGAFSDNAFYFDYGDETASAARISAAQPGGWDDAFHIVELYRSGVTMTITIDGTVLVTSGAISDDLDPTGSAELWFASQSVTGATPSDGLDMAEMVFSNVAESAGNRTAMKQYLAAKYNITVS